MTGGSGGIGKEIKNNLILNGIDVIAPNSNTLDLSQEIKDLPICKFNGFIHCAGINLLANHYEIKEDVLYKLFKINTFSFITICNKLKFNNNSNILAIGSLYSFLTKEKRLQYSMSKHALLAAVKTIALEKSKFKIKVNMISPGFVNTKLTTINNSKERIDYLNNNIPLGLTTTKDIADICMFFIKNNNSITGQNILVDGGYSLKTI